MANRSRPFSSEWFTAPSGPPEPRKRWGSQINEHLVGMLRHLPGERVMRLLLVLALLFVSGWLIVPETFRHRSDEVAQNAQERLLYNDTPESGEAANGDISTGNLTVTEGDGDTPLSTAGPTQGPSLSLSLDKPVEVQDGSILPQYRILLFYGFPGQDTMGILGQYDKQRLMEMMKEQAAAYEAADPGRPVKIGFEVIASVAQQESMADGSWLLDTPSTLLDEYTQFASEHDMLVFFDVQIGRRTVQTEVEGLRPWLELPHVHLALDPEFDMRDDWIPGEHIGQTEATDITWTQNYLVELTTRLSLPPKVLIVHQFTHTMINDKDTLTPVHGVQLVIDMDGHGSPELKTSTYTAVISNEPIEYNGIKLFYDQDKPLMTPEEVLDLSPQPDLIIYQ